MLCPPPPPPPPPLFKVKITFLKTAMNDLVEVSHIGEHVMTTLVVHLNKLVTRSLWLVTR